MKDLLEKLAKFKKRMRDKAVSRKITSIVIHCSDSEYGSAHEIYQWHAGEGGFGWDDIGYPFVVTNGNMLPGSAMFVTDGQIEIGRDINIAGAHVLGHNEETIGICLIGKPTGKYGRCRFTVAQLISARILCLELMKRYNIPVKNIFGHYELDDKKTCPGMDMNLFRDHVAVQSMPTPLNILLNSLSEV